MRYPQSRKSWSNAKAPSRPRRSISSKLAQSERLISEIKKQLDVAERVLAKQSAFIQPIQIDVVTEKDLLDEVNDHLALAAPQQN